VVANEAEPQAGLPTEVERDLEYWRARALQAEGRLDERRALDEEQIETRRRATELLEESRATVEADRDEWRARAATAESRALEAERRADVAENRTAELERQLESQPAPGAAPPGGLPTDNVPEAPESSTETTAEREQQKPRPRKPRGNWLRA
jgi:hypothetical protein